MGDNTSRQNKSDIDRWGKVKSILTILVLIISILIIVTPFALAAYYRITSGTWPNWSGFGDYYDAAGEFVRGKTLWEWMDLLVIPFVLALGAYFFNRSERRNELEIAEQARKTDREIASDRQREAILQSYIDGMENLLLNKQLQASENYSEVRAVAQARTLTALRGLDGDRKGALLLFLADARLIGRLVSDQDGQTGIAPPVIVLKGANLQEAYLVGANLSGVDLYGADLYQANLYGADLYGADLRHANLNDAYLGYANLSGADLSGTHLYDAKLRKADLTGADLRRALWYKIDLNEAIYDQDTQWPAGFDPEKAGAVYGP